MKRNSRIISIIYLLFSLAFFSYIYYRSEFFNEGEISYYYYKYYIFSFFLIFFSIISFFISQKIKEYLSIVLASIIIALYCFEGYLFYKFTDEYIKKTQKKISKKNGIYYDTRTKYEIFEDLKKQEPNIVVTINGHVYNEEENLSLLSLGGISHSKTIQCNENGYYSIYQSDRYGFNNPDEEWNENEINLILIGDSFTHGSCVNRPDDIASNLRKKHKYKNHVLNLGYKGNGPLLEYASLREYLGNKTVKNILWIFFEGNDLLNLENELKDPTLLNYFDDKNFTQNLISKQNIIDKELKKAMNINAKNYYKDNSRKLPKIENLIKFIKLYNVRLLLFPTKPKPEENFKKILNLINIFAKEKDAKLHFVYLPTFERYKHKYYKSYYNEIINIVENLEISLIDIHSRVFKNHDDPSSLFGLTVRKFYPYIGSNGHYNPKGYELVSNEIYKHINSK